MKLFLLLSLLATSVFAAPYLITTYVVVSVYTEEGYTWHSSTIPGTLYTDLETVVPASPISAITTISTAAGFAHVTLLEIVVPTGSPVPDEFYDYAASHNHTSYVVPVTYTPDPTCTGQSWSFTTTVPVYVPEIVSIAPVTTFLSASTYSPLHLDPTPTTQLVAVLNPTDVNADDLASASSSNLPWGMSYCYTPTTYCPTASAATCTTTFLADRSHSYSSSSGNSYLNDPGYCDFNDCERDWIRNLILFCVFVPVGWILLWLIIGLWESWMSFKGLMLGQHRKRGLPYAWCCISIIFLCFTGPTYKAKSVEEQAELKTKWEAMGKGEKFKLWMRWGFRWKYPDCIGEEPEVAKRALRQGCL